MICLHFLTTPPWKSLGGCDGSSILLTRKSVWMMTDRCWLWPNAFLLQLFVIILVLWARKSTREGVRYRIGPPHIPLSKCPISKDIINASSSSEGCVSLKVTGLQFPQMSQAISSTLPADVPTSRAAGRRAQAEDTWGLTLHTPFPTLCWKSHPFHKTFITRAGKEVDYNILGRFSVWECR